MQIGPERSGPFLLSIHSRRKSAHLVQGRAQFIQRHRARMIEPHDSLTVDQNQRRRGAGAVVAKVGFTQRRGRAEQARRLADAQKIAAANKRIALTAGVGLAFAIVLGYTLASLFARRIRRLEAARRRDPFRRASPRRKSRAFESWLSSQPIQSLDVGGLEAACPIVHAWASRHREREQNFVGARRVGDADLDRVEMAAHV